MDGKRDVEALQLKRVETIPTSEKISRTSVRLPDTLWQELEDATRELSEQARKDKRRPFSRDDVIAHACRWWLQAWRADLAKADKD